MNKKLSKSLYEIINKYSSINLKIDYKRLKYYQFLIDYTYLLEYNKIETDCEYIRSNNLFVSKEIDDSLEWMSGLEINYFSNICATCSNFTRLFNTKLEQKYLIILDNICKKYIFENIKVLEKDIYNLIKNLNFGDKIL